MIEEAPSKPNRAERRALLDVLARAFRDNPMNVAIHGASSARRVRANRAGLRALVLDAQDSTWVRVICNNGKVVGGFVAVPPKRFPLEPPALKRFFGCFIHQGARAMDKWAFVSQSLSERHPLEDHWYLAVLGVAPEFQGQGVGGRLLDTLRARAEEENTPIYLESDRDESVQFYLRRGFESCDEVGLLGVTCHCLGLGFPQKNRDLCDSVREL
jgi:GNAT superfamily N-acetyltransferase